MLRFIKAVMTLDTEGKRQCQEKKILGLLRGVPERMAAWTAAPTTSSGLNTLVGHLAVEQVGDEFDDARNTSGTTAQDNFMDIRLVYLGVLPKDLLNRIKSSTEKILEELFETGTS